MTQSMPSLLIHRTSSPLGHVKFEVVLLPFPLAIKFTQSSPSSSSIFFANEPLFVVLHGNPLAEAGVTVATMATTAWTLRVPGTGLMSLHSLAILSLEDS